MTWFHEKSHTMEEEGGHDVSDLHWLKNHPLLLRGGSEPLRRRLYRVLRQAVVDGRLQAGAILPSTRSLADLLEMARNTVLYAYEQLAAEGYVRADRQGTVVCALGPRDTRTRPVATLITDCP